MMFAECDKFEEKTNQVSTGNIKLYKETAINERYVPYHESPQLMSSLRFLWFLLTLYCQMSKVKSFLSTKTLPYKYNNVHGKK